VSPVEYVLFLTDSGYSQAAQDAVIAMYRDGGFDINLKQLHPFPQAKAFSPERWRVFSTLLGKPAKAAAVQFYHCTPVLQRRCRKLLKTVGFATFESHEPPPDWVEILNSNHAVVVPSRFCEGVFREAGVVKPIFHVPHAVDTTIYHPSVTPLDVGVGGFTFLFFGTWSRRKGWETLLEAFWREFGPDEGVSLVVKTNRVAAFHGDVAAFRKNLGLGGKELPPVRLESRVFDETLLPRFLKSADCLVSPTMGEGFGLPPLQSMALGVPVIVTNYSGCQDYATGDTATLLEPDGFVRHEQMDGIFQFRGRRWAHVPVASLRGAMRRVFENVEEAKEKARFAATEVSRKFGYPQMAQNFRAVVGALNEC
jgi:glycosyltransferase involved in cell wall biosynthesis